MLTAEDIQRTITALEWTADLHEAEAERLRAQAEALRAES